MSYYVYFNASSNNCSGWLDVNNTDIAVNGHFFEWATAFETEEEAKVAAEKRLSELHALCDETEQMVKSDPHWNGQDYDKEEAKKKYRYRIFKKCEN